MFPLFNKQTDLAKFYFDKLLTFGDSAIDATCGNGHDTLFLAQHTLTADSGTLYSLDIQQEALDSAKKLLQEKLGSPLLKRIHFLKMCHSEFPPEIAENSVKLIVYNLGYLPGGNKEITTKYETTLRSVNNALKLVMPGGAISITCYPGHPAGKVEEDLILEFTATLDPKEWNCCHHRLINRNTAPSLLLIQKRRFA